MAGQELWAVALEDKWTGERKRQAGTYTGPEGKKAAQERADQANEVEKQWKADTGADPLGTYLVIRVRKY